MTQLTRVNTGSVPDDGTGDTLRVAFTVINQVTQGIVSVSRRMGEGSIHSVTVVYITPADGLFRLASANDGLGVGAIKYIVLGDAASGATVLGYKAGYTCSDSGLEDGFYYLGQAGEVVRTFDNSSAAYFLYVGEVRDGQLQISLSGEYSL